VEVSPWTVNVKSPAVATHGAASTPTHNRVKNRAPRARMRIAATSVAVPRRGDDRPALAAPSGP
jgi:hypothetical protein